MSESSLMVESPPLDPDRQLTLRERLDLTLEEILRILMDEGELREDQSAAGLMIENAEIVAHGIAA